MLNLTREYEAIYWGESPVAQQHPELIKGRAYKLKLSELQGQLIVRPVSRIDLKNDQIVIRGSLSIPQQLYSLDDELTKDWALAEWPYDWAKLRESGGKAPSMLPSS